MLDIDIAVEVNIALITSPLITCTYVIDFLMLVRLKIEILEQPDLLGKEQIIWRLISKP